MNNRLTILARSGLCNKLRVLFTALYAAEKCKMQLSLAWLPVIGCRMEFGDYFKPINGVRIVSDERELIDDIFISTMTIADNTDIMKYQNGCNLFLISCGAVTCGGTKNDIMVRHTRNRLILKDDVADEIESYASQYIDDKTIGFHIRATEHFLDIVPIEKYEQEISILPKNIKIYLATDKPGVYERLRDRFGNRIIYKEKTFGCDTKEGMRDGIVDLYLLNKCKMIYGVHTSSYSWMSSIIKNDVPLEIL